MDNTLKRERMGVILIDSVSLSPLYLIHPLILHPRTSSKNGLCGLCAETDCKTEQMVKPVQKQNKVQTSKKKKLNYQQNKNLFKGFSMENNSKKWPVVMRARTISHFIV
jgi:hypothetical protein